MVNKAREAGITSDTASHHEWSIRLAEMGWPQTDEAVLALMILLYLTPRG